MEEESRTPIPEWLKHLQENSWELELLISGGAVFTLVQFPESLIGWVRSVRVITDLLGANMFLITSMTAIKILTNGFILHLLLRSFWLALVCINFVFPQGITSAHVLKTGPFRSRHLEGDLRNQIMTVDRICGLVIFMAIISSLIVCGMAVVLALNIFLSWLPDRSGSGILFHLLRAVVTVNFWMMVIYVADLLSMGILRRIPYLSYLLVPHFWLSDGLSFRRFYSRAMVMFSSNVGKWSFRLGPFLFAVATMLSMYFTLFNAMHWPNLFDARDYVFQIAPGGDINSIFYKDEAEGIELNHVYIPSKIIENNYLEVNLRYLKILDGYVEGASLPDSLQYVSSVINLFIDDSLYQNQEWRPYWKKSISEATLMTMVPISNLPEGLHYLSIRAKDFPYPKYRNWAKQQSHRVKIPFWKDVH